MRADITQATLIREGEVGGSPEIYEKIHPTTGRGVVSVFAGAPGRYDYVTQALPAREFWHTEGVTVTFDAAGHARIEMHFQHPGAHLIFFGVAPEAQET